MAFWDLPHPADSLAAIVASSGLQRTYGELRSDVERSASAMPQRPAKSLLMLLARNNYESLVVYLAALRSGNALLLADATTNHDLLAQLVDTYRPDFIYESSDDDFPGYHSLQRGLSARNRKEEEAIPIHPSLALLLSTSGSTGSPKLVRLSQQNVQTNAAAIASYLSLTAAERPITSLPMAYSYGLSVFNSHLLAGACLTLTDHGILRREFWDAVERWQCTSFAGVPYSYQMLLQTGLLNIRGASLRTITQAGGALAEPLIRDVHELAAKKGIRFFVMYGQTEATARIAYLPPEDLSRKIGSIGVPIPGGRLHVEAGTGELVYTGPNVMLGYAENRTDLMKGDELGGVLQTGDLARCDDEGFFYITGRIKRFLKLFGKRFSLDEIEQIVQRRFGFPVACFGYDDHLQVAVEAKPGEEPRIQEMLRESFGLPQAAIEVEIRERLPRTSRGKTDYQALATQPQKSAALTGSSARAVETQKL